MPLRTHLATMLMGAGFRDERSVRGGDFAARAGQGCGACPAAGAWATACPVGGGRVAFTRLRDPAAQEDSGSCFAAGPIASAVWLRAFPTGRLQAVAASLAGAVPARAFSTSAAALIARATRLVVVAGIG